jgi:predicted lipid-binding transport protein (Tim44 family)
MKTITDWFDAHNQAESHFKELRESGDDYASRAAAAPRDDDAHADADLPAPSSRRGPLYGAMAGGLVGGVLCALEITSFPGLAPGGYASFLSLLAAGAAGGAIIADAVVNLAGAVRQYRNENNDDHGDSQPPEPGPVAEASEPKVLRIRPLEFAPAHSRHYFAV